MAKRIRHIMSCVACMAAAYFSTLSHMRYDFRECIQGGAEPTDTFQMVIHNIWE